MFSTARGLFIVQSSTSAISRVVVADRSPHDFISGVGNRAFPVAVARSGNGLR